jgi:hypothetical protein
MLDCSQWSKRYRWKGKAERAEGDEVMEVLRDELGRVSGGLCLGESWREIVGLLRVQSRTENGKSEYRVLGCQCFDERDGKEKELMLSPRNAESHEG